MLNLGNLLTQTAYLYPDRTGLVKGRERWTWWQLEQSANGLARALLELGIGPGDRVLAQGPNSRWMLEAQYAVMRTGAIHIPVNPRAIPRESAQMAKLSGAKALIMDTSLAANAALASGSHDGLRHVITTAPVAESSRGSGRAVWHVYDELATRHAGETVAHAAKEDDVCFQMYTAGTTGVPKGAFHSQRSLLAGLIGRIADVMPGVDKHCALLAIGPLSHGTGTTCTICVMRGAKIVMLEGARFDVGDCWRLIEEERISEIFTVPTMLIDLARHPEAKLRDRSSLRHVVYAGAPINRAEQKEALEMFGASLVQYYGSTENMGTATVLYPSMHSMADDDPECPVGTCGVARSGVNIEIRSPDGKALPAGETGEIWIHGPGNFLGYQDMPEATAQTLKNGWVNAGDLGRMDERGFVYIVGRSREMYKSGGFQVYPNETQNYLTEHPAVAEAHIVSFPDSRWGEIGVAVVQLLSGHTATETELREFLRARMAAYKLPRRFWFWEQIPRSAVGKVPKALLREEILRRGLVKEGQDIPVLGAGEG